MRAPRVVAVVSLLSLIVTGAGAMRASDAQPAAPPPGDTPPSSTRSFDVTPSRLSYVYGEVSFWRPGAQDWAPAKLNTALEPGDVLYVAQPGSAEIQIGPRAFVRASETTQIGLDNQEPDYLQFRVTAGHAAVDIRELAPGQTVEIDTPNAAFTVERAGYYRIDVAGDSVGFSTHRGGRALVTPASGSATPITAGQQATVTGTDSPRVDVGAAPPLTTWDQWNYTRTADALRPAPTQYVSPEIYGAQELDRYGAWRAAPTYGQVWIPNAVPASWVPYSTGRWIWDPIYGWTWLDDAPWGWAPYHYGRWVFIDSVWAWAPGPRVRPVYSPAFVVFLGGATAGRPLAWAPLGWGEPVIPWWGRPGFAGVPWWGGWGGPRVVNNVVVSNTTVVNVQNITVYRNVHVENAVVGVPAERFGRDRVAPTRLSHADVQELAPIRGAVPAKPVATSVMPAVAAAPKPPAAIQERPIVATRPAADVSPILRAHGLSEKPDLNRSASPRLVPSPKATAASPNSAGPSVSPPAPRATNEATRPPTPAPGSSSGAPPPQRERSRPDAVAKPEPPRANGERRALESPRAVQPPAGASREAPPPAQRRDVPTLRAEPPASGQRPDRPAPTRDRVEPQGDASPSPDRAVRPQRGPSRDAPPSSGVRPPAPPVPGEAATRGERSRAEPHTRAEPPNRVGPQGNVTPPAQPPKAAPSREAATPPAARSEAHGERPSRGEPPSRGERQDRSGQTTP